MANQMAVRLDKVGWRVLVLVLTRPQEKRDLRTAGRLMELDKTIKAAIDPYDEQVEELAAAARKLTRRRQRLGELEFESQMSDINDEIEALADAAEREEVEILFSVEDANFIGEQFKDITGVPADRKQGQIYQRIKTALDAAEKVPVLKAVPEAKAG